MSNHAYERGSQPSQAGIGLWMMLFMLAVLTFVYLRAS